MVAYRNIKGLCIFVILIFALTSFESCGPKIYPSGMEYDLMGYKSNSKKIRRKRERESQREVKAKEKLTCQVQKNVNRAKTKAEKERSLLLKKNIEMQAPHVQKRIAENQRRTERFYASLRNKKRKFTLFGKRK